MGSQLRVFLLVIFWSIAGKAYAQCPLVQQIGLSARQLWSSVLDTGHTQYLVARSDQALSVYEAVRNPFLQLIQKFSIPVQSSDETSVAYSKGDLVVSLWRPVTISGNSLTPTTLSNVYYYRLSDGLINTSRAQSLSSSTLLPSPQASAPFYQSTLGLASWQQPICSGGASPNSQYGRLVAASRDRVFIAHPGEQENYCNPNPNYYRYHLLPNGQPEMQIARVSTNALGQPAGLPLCDVQPGFSGVAQCVGTPQDTCQALSGSGQVLNVPGACSLRLEPRPVLPFEFCPTCPYWWSVVDPGGFVFDASSSSTPTLLSRVTFPNDPLPADPLDPGSTGFPPQGIHLGTITSMRADPLGAGFAIVADVSSPEFGLPHYGGVFFYDADGQYKGFGTTLVADSYVGENGAIAPIGRDATGASIYAVGSPRNRPRGSGGWNLPPNSFPELNPEAGHVSYFSDDAARLNTDFGDNANDQYGAALVALGDINTDGGADVLIGAPGGNYVSLMSATAPFNGDRGPMYTFSGAQNSEFGKQVAAISSAGVTVADTAIIASRDTLFVYDLATCAGSLVPSPIQRQLLKQLLPPLLTEAQNIVPDPNGPIPNISSALNPIHPFLEFISYRMPEFISVLTSSPNNIPSNEEIRGYDLDNSTSHLNQSSNIRDIARAELVKLAKKEKKEDKLCKKAGKNKNNSHCKALKKIKADIKKRKKEKSTAVSTITFWKNVLVTNLTEIRAELP